MTKTLSIRFFLIIAAIVLGSFVFANAGITLHLPVQPREVQPFTFLSATTTSATSSNAIGGVANITGAQKVELQFSRGDATGTGNAGQTMFRVQVSADLGATWNDYPKLVLATSTTQAAQSNIFLSGTSTALVALDLRTDTFTSLRVVSLETTDGEATAKGLIEF